MPPETPFEDVMARLRAGDDAAASEVFHRFARRLIGLARSRLDHVVRQKVDPEDILQSVYRSFFSRHADGEFQFDSWESLWGLLTLITVRKCSGSRKFFRAARRNIEREVEPQNGDDVPVFARDPTPSEAVHLTETVEQLLRELPRRENDILALSLQGFDAVEISERVGRTERTVQRVLKRVREQLESMLAVGNEHWAGNGQ